MKKYYIFGLVMAILLVGFSSISYATATASNNGSNTVSGSQSVADQHLSEVSRFVQNLNTLAGKDQNIGLEIKAVATEQADTASKSAEAINSIEHRNSLVTFLFGTDYGRIGTLRSQLVTNQNEINRLTRAMARATSPDVKAGLQKQIDALKAIGANINQFITVNETKFSVLGWAVRLFSGQ